MSGLQIDAVAFWYAVFRVPIKKRSEDHISYWFNLYSFFPSVVACLVLYYTFISLFVFSYTALFPLPNSWIFNASLEEGRHTELFYSFEVRFF